MVNDQLSVARIGFYTLNQKETRIYYLDLKIAIN